MKEIPRWVILLFSVVILFLIGWFFSNIVAYVLIAGVLSIIGQPVIEKLVMIKVKGFNLPRSIASVMTMGLMLFALLLFIAVFIPLIVSEAKMLASIDFDEVAETIKPPLQRLEEWVQRTGLQESGVPLTEMIQIRLKELVNITNVSNVVNSIIGVTGNIFVTFFSVSFILFFFLNDKNLFYNILMMLSPSDDEKRMHQALSGIKNLLTRYFIGILIQVAILITVINTGLFIIGIDNALLIGFFGGILNIVPYVGPFIAALLGITLGVASSFPLELYPAMFWLVVKIISVFAIAQMLDNFILQPFIFSNTVKAHPLEIFLVILAAGSIAGVGGMILAIPVYTVFRVIAKEFLGEFKIIKKLTEVFKG